MKKITKLCLVALLLMTGLISGCGNNSESKKEEKQEEKQEEKKEEKQEVSFDEVLGDIEDDKYENTYAGIAFVLDDSWIVEDNQAIKDELDEMVEEATDGTSLANAVEKYDQIRDILAAKEDGSSFNVVIQNKTEQDNKNFKMFNEKQLLESSLIHEDALIETYENIGFENVKIDIKEITFLGEKHYALHTQADYLKTKKELLQIMIFDKDNYHFTITASSDEIEKCEAILESFKKA